MANGAHASRNATYRVLRELGARSQHSYAVIREAADGTGRELVVVNRFARGDATKGPLATRASAESMALLLRDARCLERAWHPNIARIRHVELAGSELTIASELVEGATLADLAAAAGGLQALGLPVVARVLLDVLAGLQALHGLRDGIGAPLGAMHGELCPINVVVGRDGVARLVNVIRPRPVRLSAGSEALPQAAPEALDAGGTADPRADLHAVAAILWEALAGRPPYEERDPALLLARQRGTELPSPTIADDPLGALALSGLSFDPGGRPRSAAEMITELRAALGSGLASGSAVAARVTELEGERIRDRRGHLDPTHSGTRRRASAGAIAAARRDAGPRDPRVEPDDSSAPEKATVARPRFEGTGVPAEGPLVLEDLVDVKALAALSARPSPKPARSVRVEPLGGPLARPAPSRPSGVARAVPRIAAPTMPTEVPVELLAASKSRALAPSDPGTTDDEREEPAGPRGSSPDIDPAAIAREAVEPERALPDDRVASTPSASPIASPAASLVRLTPRTPHLPLESLSPTPARTGTERMAPVGSRGGTAAMPAVTAPPAVVSSPALPFDPSLSPAAGAVLVAPTRRTYPRGLVAGVAVAVLALIGVVVAIWSSRTPQDAPVVSPAPPLTAVPVTESAIVVVMPRPTAPAPVGKPSPAPAVVDAPQAEPAHAPPPRTTDAPPPRTTDAPSRTDAPRTTDAPPRTTDAPRPRPAAPPPHATTRSIYDPEGM